MCMGQRVPSCCFFVVEFAFNTNILKLSARLILALTVVLCCLRPNLTANDND